MINYVSFEGLNEEKTLKEIKRIKRVINKIVNHPGEYYGKEVLDDETIFHPTFDPAEEVTYICYRKFLQDGIKHLENDLHISYNYSKKELKEKDFLDKLKYVKKFTFIYEVSKVELTFSKDTFDVYSEYIEDLIFSSYVHNTEKTKDAFLKEIFDCHLECWKKYERLPLSCVPTIHKYRHKIEIEYYDDYKKEVITGKYDIYESLDRLISYMYKLATKE